jgi:hypothetical protein
VKGGKVGRRQSRVRDRESHNGGKHEDDAARSFTVQKRPQD